MGEGGQQQPGLVIPTSKRKALLIDVARKVSTKRPIG